MVMRARIIAMGLFCAALAGCGFGGSGSTGPITIGAVTFAENQIVAEMYAQVLEDAGYTVDRRFNFQRREDLYPDLSSGDVDLSPEYLASLLTFLEPEATASSDAEENVSTLAPLLEEDGLELLTPAAANDTNAFVVTAETAADYNLETVSDLKLHGQHLTFGGPPECPERRFCLQGLEEVYGVTFKRFKPLDAGGPLTVAALGSNQIQVGLMFSTSGVIAERGWLVLEDDKGLQAAENITPLIRSDVIDDDIADLLNEVGSLLTTAKLTELNGRVEGKNEDFRKVARDFLRDEGLL